MHIPPPEYINAYNQFNIIYGHRGEGVGCPRVNTGFVDSLISRNVKAVYCGHDHKNDYGGFYKGI